jgi:hypothetical protein
MDVSPPLFFELDAKIQRIFDNIEVMKEKQIDMADDIAKIKDAVYNPDEGIYARLREIETWKKNQSKMMWILLTASIGVCTAAAYNTLFM